MYYIIVLVALLVTGNILYSQGTQKDMLEVEMNEEGTKVEAEKSEVIENNNEATGVNISEEKEEVSRIDLVEVDLKLTDNLEIEELPVTVPEGSELGSYAYYDGKVYYAVLYLKEMANYATKVEIYSMDAETHVSELVHSEEGNELYINELKANENKLIWVKFLPTLEWSINAMDIDSNEKKIIRSSSDTNWFGPICLSLSESYLSWFEGEIADEEKEEPSVNSNLMIYELSSKNLIEMDKAYMATPFERASIVGDNVSYVVKSDGRTAIRTKNIKSGVSTDSFPPKDSVVNVKSNNQYVIWHDEFGVSDIYIQSNESDYVIHSDRFEIFSLDLIGDCLYINDRKSKNILCINLTDKTLYTVTDHLNNNKNLFVMGAKSVDNVYTAQNITPEGVSILYIKDAQ